MKTSKLVSQKGRERDKERERLSKKSGGGEGVREGEEKNFLNEIVKFHALV